MTVLDTSGKPVHTDVVTGAPAHIPLYNPPNPDKLTAHDVQQLAVSVVQHEFYVRDQLNAQRAMDEKKKARIHDATMVAAGVAVGALGYYTIQRIRRGRDGQQGGGNNAGGGR